MLANKVLDVYDAHLHLATTERSWATLRRGLPTVDEESLQRAVPTSAGICWSAVVDGKFHVVLWVDVAKHKTPGGLINTVSHEATHASLMIVEQVEHVAHAHDEPTAYLVGWLTEWIWRAATGH